MYCGGLWVELASRSLRENCQSFEMLKDAKPGLILKDPSVLRADLGMESTSLDDVLYRYASFRNLVDPITHDLIISLARYIHCPKPSGVGLERSKCGGDLKAHLS
ncbi:hypothetical protein llap_15631 [Limosa lapponica baueri]|uniref:Uncharacterized protein n=1 Tax=Limosa lapponica baueri TaxID=1758121 RepID=A0A2I0TJX1_LIMLA|nr:hypothetical protein llap_15631 [Limosa lapponica baueri]